MSSTEQKNVTQHFIDHCFTYGILPTIASGIFSNFALDTDSSPFSELGSTPSLYRRLQTAEDPIAEACRIFPVLRDARWTTRASPFLLRLCHGSRVYYGNQGVMRLCEAILSHRCGLFFNETGAIRHAKRHTATIASFFAPGSYSRVGRTSRNASRLLYSGESYRCRIAADAIEYICGSLHTGKHASSVRVWCGRNRSKCGFKSGYFRQRSAVEDFKLWDRSCLDDVDFPPAVKQKCFGASKQSRYTCEVYRHASNSYIRLASRSGERISAKSDHSSEVFVFSRRDIADLRFLLISSALIRSYHRKREADCIHGRPHQLYCKLSGAIWEQYKRTMRQCGQQFELRNKLGVYFDVLQWRYLARLSGNEFYDHSHIMAQKIHSKGLSLLEPQEPLLTLMSEMPPDMCVDLLGIYKASIYPEVDPFKVVCDQYKLHYSRFDTDWADGSTEKARFEDTKAYMWYFGVRVIHKKMHVWPGRIRDGVDEKDWHKEYKSKGIPGAFWRDAHDVDLLGSVPIADISNEQYMKQQDSACAPPFRHEYADFNAMRKAPRHHKRKLLYTVQEEKLPDLPESLEYLNGLGEGLPDGYIDNLDHDLPFSTDIVTGSRCERHKDAPRPFYAASPPWGCILSYFDGITRDFLNNVPQSMLGKSTRQKFLDLSTAAHQEVTSAQNFFMSDDKAKYSPRMDPRSQQLPADFFAEVFNLPAMKACGPIMYHNKLFYRVCGHLVSYSSNGTDREGMRGASNTWLEIVAQGLATRISRERGLIIGKSVFLSFIDDGLRRFSVAASRRTDDEVRDAARCVIDEVIFGLKVLGRELSWDKTFVSRDLFVILNELVYDGAHLSSGLKSLCTAGDLEIKDVMSASDYEQLYFSKMRGAHGVGAPLDLCHTLYIFETLASHYRMGVNLQDNRDMNNLEYRLFCCTPLALGGGGLRSMAQMGSNEVSDATREGMGSILRLSKNEHLLSYPIECILEQNAEPISPIDFMREPDQFHVYGPRIRTQRVAAEIRKSLYNLASNSVSRAYLERDRDGMDALESMGKVMMAMEVVSAEEVRLLYASTPVAFVDEFIQKVASSSTMASLLGGATLTKLRRLVKKDLIRAANYFRFRCNLRSWLYHLANDANVMLAFRPLLT